jgi:prophage antirepressor-like protein
MRGHDQLRQFQSVEFGPIEVLLLEDRPYFPAKECAAILGYAKPHNAISRHCHDSLKRGVTDRFGRIQEKLYIPEGDLYRLIIRSKLPAAVRFERWVFDEVLPTLRRYGAYATSDTLDEILASPDFTESLIKRLEKECRRREVLEGLASEMAPKALYCDEVLQCKNAIPVSVIAKDYGMTAASFNRLLHALGVQYKVNGTWLLYQKYANQGYTRTRTFHVDKSVAKIHTCWTQKGRLFLYGLLRECGILPLTERLQRLTA